MTLQGNRTFVGFGFGAIQAGLFLYEAFKSGNFGRLVAAEIAPEVVLALRQSGGRFTVNIAHSDHIEAARVGPVEIGNPSVDADRDLLVAAVAEADEISTAVPSVDFYVSAGPGSIHRILAEGLVRKVRQNGPHAVVYCAENHNHAAQVLQDKVFGEIPAHSLQAARRRVKFLNTVIGKMSGVVPRTEADKTGLETITPGLERAFLVESFNRILISSILFEDYRFERGIRAFSEKNDLLPFEEAKLYGHNAVHALCAYLGSMRDIHRIAELREMPDMMAFLRAAFLEESGEALIRKHAGVDALFTRAGYTQYADDLLARMVNPFLLDTVDRVGRDPDRKIGWNDRLIGTMRVALSHNVKPSRFAVGAAAALVCMNPAALDTPENALTRLQSIWSDVATAGAEQRAILDLISAGFERLQRWVRNGRGSLENEIRS